MAKPNTGPKSVDTLANIVEQVVALRFVERTPTLSDLARLVNTASRLLRFHDVDERIETENKVTLAVAKKLSLIG